MKTLTQYTNTQIKSKSSSHYGLDILLFEDI